VIESTDGRKFAVGGKNLRYPVTQAQKQQYLTQARRSLAAQQFVGPKLPAGPIPKMSILADYASTPRNLAAWYPNFVPVYDMKVKEWRRRSIRLAGFMRTATPYFALKSEDLAIVNQVLEHDRLSGAIQLTGNNMVVKFSNPAAELSKPGETVTVTDAQKKGYWAVRRAMNDFLTDLRDTVLQRFKLPKGLSSQQVLARVTQAPQATAAQLGLIPVMTPQAMTSMQALKKTLATQQAAWTREKDNLEFVAGLVKQIEDLRKTGYVPFSRFGETRISVNDAATGGLVGYYSTETGMMDWLGLKLGGKGAGGAGQFMNEPSVREMNELAKRRHAGQNVVISEPYEMPTKGLPKGANLADVEVLADMAQVDRQTWMQMLELLDSAKAKQGMKAHFFQSRNIPGYSTDFRRAIAQYFTQGAGFLSRMEYQERISNALGDLAVTEKTNPRLVNYANDWIEYTDSPQEEALFVRQVNFIYTMTSPSTWAVNAGQPVGVSMPWAAQFADPHKVAAAFMRAGLDAVKMLSTRSGFAFYTPQAAPKDIGVAKMQEWFDNGEAVPLSTLDAMGVAQGRDPAVGMQRMDQIMLDTLAAGFTLSERQNRITTLIALYRLARDNPEVKTNFARVMRSNALAQQTVIDKWSPTAFAEYGNEDTNFLQGKVNRARLQRGKIGTTVMQMRGFNWQSIELWARSAVKGGKEGVAAVAAMMLYTLLLGGLYALPGIISFTEWGEKLAKLIGKVDYDTRTYVRKWLHDYFGDATIANVVMGGATTAAPDEMNADLQARVGFGKLFPTDIGELIGVSWGTFVKRPMNIMSAMSFENYLLAMSELFPRMAQDPLVALAWSQQGIRSKASNKPLIKEKDVTAGMLLQKMGGFTSSTISLAREREHAETRLKNATNEKRHALYSRMAVAIEERGKAYGMADQEGMDKATQTLQRVFSEIKEWNAGHALEYQIHPDGKAIMGAVMNEQLGADYNRGAPKLTRKAIEDLQRLYRSRE